jgi:hypothetical protein
MRKLATFELVDGSLVEKYGLSYENDENMSVEMQTAGYESGYF